MWTLQDNTKERGPGGYLSILKDGIRVCDAFPFSSPHTKEHQQFVREQAYRIVDAMNAIDMVQCPGETTATSRNARS